MKSSLTHVRPRSIPIVTAKGTAIMEYRPLGRAGLKVPALSLGTGTFGGSGPLFGAWGRTDTVEARRLVDICLEAGVNLFDTANMYSRGMRTSIRRALRKRCWAPRSEVADPRC